MSKNDLHLIYGAVIVVLLYLLFNQFSSNTSAAASAAATNAVNQLPSQLGNDAMNFLDASSGFQGQPGLSF
jgi:hypothetical protein